MPFLLIDKPTGITSHDVINRLRQITNIKRIGHAGTLDPFATGLLIVAIERESTRELRHFLKLDKEYIATLKLGEVSDTYDRDGKIEKWEMRNGKWRNGFKKIISHFSFLISDHRTPLSIKKMREVLQSFLGPQTQIPPMYSAKKVGGQKLYQLARQGKEIPRWPEDIEIYDIKLLEYNFPKLVIKVKCSSGTYIRSLAHDIGQKLKIGAYLEELERTKVGEYDLKNAADLEKLTPENWKEFTFEVEPRK